MTVIYLDGWAVEYVYSAEELRDALAYWSALGVVEARPSPNLLVLSA